jgi:hypothetical protein
MRKGCFSAMIIYDVRCIQGHTFEGWFQDRKAFEEQKERQLISCPVCGSTNADVILSSVSVMGRDTKGEKEQEESVSPMKALQCLQEYIEKNFEDVGSHFAEVAIRIHYGEEKGRNIRGTTTKKEEETLQEEGIKFIKIPTPKFDS